MNKIIFMKITLQAEDNINSAGEVNQDQNLETGWRESTDMM